MTPKPVVEDWDAKFDRWLQKTALNLIEMHTQYSGDGTIDANMAVALLVAVGGAAKTYVAASVASQVSGLQTRVAQREVELINLRSELEKKRPLVAPVPGTEGRLFREE